MASADRPYQVASIEGLRQGFRDHHTRQVLAAPTGAGKSVIMLEMIQRAMEKGSRILFICERRILVEQFSRHLDAQGIDHGIMMSKHWRFKPQELVQIATAQTLEKMESWPAFDICFVDEIHACFVAGTKVDGKPIEDIQIGDYVMSFNHESGKVERKMVLHTFKHQSSSLVKVNVTNTTPIICTQDHPFFTGEDYENAKHLTNTSVLYSIYAKQHGCKSEKTILSTDHTALPILRGSVSTNIIGGWDIQESRKSSSLQKGSMSGFEKRTEQGYESAVDENIYGEWRAGTNENRKPHVSPRNERESQKQTSRNWAQAKSSWGQWLCDAGIATLAFIGAWGWVGSRVPRSDRMQEGSRRTNMPENRYSKSDLQDCSRAGWIEPQQFYWEGEGCAKILSLDPVGVDSIEIQEQGCLGKHTGNSDNTQTIDVFNIEVEGNNNYFVEGVLVHNCMRKSIKQMMTNFPKLKVVGATATPFHPELGKYFSSVTSVISMSELVEKAYLVPFRVFVTHEIDTSGIKIVAGEWKKDELEARGQQIVGDVVADYIRISNEVFGRHSKAICFSCGVAHGADLARKFAEAGVNAVQISSNDEDEYRAEVLTDFAKPDTSINVLISVSILSRGFDQTDVEHVILARPLKKSFSEHVQMVGRGARTHPEKKFCIARDSLVLTDSGLVEIQNVSLDNKVWDGVNFVSHQGAVCRGVKPVIHYDGITATPEHEVMTNDGWQRLEEAARRRLWIARTGDGCHPIRLAKNLFTDYAGQRSIAQSRGDMQQVPQNPFCTLLQHQQASRNTSVPSLQPAQGCASATMDLQALSSATTALRKSIERGIRAVRDAWHSIQISVSGSCCELGVRGIGHSIFAELSAGQNRQRWALRAWKSALEQSGTQHEQHASFGWPSKVFWVQGSSSRSSLCGQDIESNASQRYDDGADSAKLGGPVMQTEREVWDILNAGPLQRFTVDGRLVHNCVIQDNSGNWLRFKDSWDEFYSNGVNSLNEGADEKPRKEPSEKDKAAAKCPRCGHLWSGGSDVCSHCGAIRARRNEVLAVAGEMSELTLVPKKEKYSADYKESFYAQLLGYAQEKGHAPGSAYHRYVEKFGVGPSMAKPAPEAPGPEVCNWIRSRQIAYAKRRKTA